MSSIIYPSPSTLPEQQPQEQQVQAENNSFKEPDDSTTKQQKPRRIIRRRRRAAQEPVPIDADLLRLAHEALPVAYSFELEKTVGRILRDRSKHIALQLPEGLLMYSAVLADFLSQMVDAARSKSANDPKHEANQGRLKPLMVSILGDVTYGACCIDDLGAQSLGADLLVHYGHSCLVPVSETVIPCLYVFVEIQMDVRHCIECFHATLSEKHSEQHLRIYLLATVQFRHALAEARDWLLENGGYTDVTIPQAKPLSPGEVLGCTSPNLPDDDKVTSIVLFLADGRFHLESTLISNPHVVAYRYDPYGKVLTLEQYAHGNMYRLRNQAIEDATRAQTFGIVLGTLGRQDNPVILDRVRELLRNNKKRYLVVLVSEMTPAKFALFPEMDAWVQIACPRLSVDWGHALSDKPVLNPYEVFCLFGETGDGWRRNEAKGHYAMDYYSRQGGPWTNYYTEETDTEETEEQKTAR